MKLSVNVVLQGKLYRAGEDSLPDSINLPEGLKKYIIKDGKESSTKKGSTKKGAKGSKA